MSGTVVILIVILALLVIVVGSILIFGLSRLETRSQSNNHQRDNDHNSSEEGDQ